MKRYVALLAILMVFVVVPVFAETSTDPEPTILFRNNEWGSSLPEVLASFPDNVRFYNLDADSAYQVEKTIIDEGRQYYNGHVCGYTYARSSSLTDMKVAGYDVSGITLRFAWVPGDDGLIVEDQDHTALYYAKYEITPKDPEAVLADLTTKLSSLYGEPDATKTSGSVIKETYTIWYGGEGSIVALVGRNYSSGSYEIEIRYATTQGNEMLQTAYDALILQETLDAATSVDGL